LRQTLLINAIIKYVSKDFFPLNPEQKAAVEYEGKSLLVLAGAGSGKTRVITYRIAHILQYKNVQPWQILAITFTNKAASELKRRLYKILSDTQKDANAIWAHTFHAACLRILRKEHDKAGLVSNFVIYDTSDSLQLIKNILRDLAVDDKRFRPNSFLSEISSLKSEMSEPEEAQGYCFEKLLYDVFRIYNNRLKMANALDFDDIILRTIDLFKNSCETANKYRQQFKYIFVDEYQDTNIAQYMLLKSLYSPENYITVVGDTDQSIYSFRGADIRNIQEFEADWAGAKTIILNQNYRSTNTILQAANSIIKDISSHYKKELWSDLGVGEKIVICETDNDEAEAQFISNEIERLINIENYKPKDVACFYRANAMSRPIEQALIEKAIPYKILGGTKFYDRKEIRDIMAYLKVINNPFDDISLLRVINFPARGLGKTSVEKVAQFAKINNISFYDALNKVEEITNLSLAAKRKFQDFMQMLRFAKITADDISNSKTATDIVSFVNDVVEKSGIRQYFEFSTDPQDQVRLENVEAFVNVAKSWKDDTPSPTLEKFLEMLALMSDTDALPISGKDNGFVTLMTLHSAKGLEYPIVFFMGLENGTTPSRLSMDNLEELNEERRLAYVGVTRAKERLYLTWAASRLVWGQVTHLTVSPYVNDIDLGLTINQVFKNNKYTNNNNSFKSKYGFYNRY
jgi:DNA helicase-2/ATP-dependent DNA helicase PcrA